MAVQAIVARIRVRPHPNADKLQLGTCLGNQVVVGPDTKDGEIGVFFPSDLQLSEEFCKVHDLIGRTGADGKHEGGFFAKNRRVRIQKLRGEKSEGFWVPLSYFDYTGAGLSLDLGIASGYEFTELNGHPICNKYVSPATARHQANRAAQPAKSNVMFAKHFDTEQLRHHIGDIPVGALIHITEKLHGTSHRIGNVMNPVAWKDMDWPQRIVYVMARLMGGDQPRAWREIHGSRNVVLDSLEADQFHGGNFRATATEPLKGQLHKGEVIYGEIVGYSGLDTPIMTTQETDKLKDKTIRKQYGPKMTYSYGCAPGQAKFYIYRITQVNEDGYAVDLSWFQAFARCKELGVPPVPWLLSFMYDGDQEKLLQTVTDFAAPRPSTIDPRHIREGVVVRVEFYHGAASYKAKSFEFLVLEDSLKERDDMVDIEEAS